MIQFILNQKTVTTDLPPGELLLDYIRYHQHLTGTKIGCREGDCGACTVLIGEIKNGALEYRSATSCLMALGNVTGKHVVTVEGVNMDDLNPVQLAMSEEGATQCGFCTPGFVVSLAGFCLSSEEPTYKNAIAAIDGNICRCTGYKSIERAAAKVVMLLEERKGGDAILYATIKNLLPSYFNSVKERLEDLQKTNGLLKEKPHGSFLGGGTDLYVQQHESMVNADLQFLFDDQLLKGITKDGDKCLIGGSSTVTDLVGSPIIREHFPRIFRFIKLVSSTPIRNMATIAGNFINASPIGDLTVFFLALDAQIILCDGKKKREIPLRKLYKGYKDLDKKPGEFIEKIWFHLPRANTHFNFEKVSKRTHLDIASVNTAINISVSGDVITAAALAAGGVAPVPLYLKNASAFLINKKISEELIEKVIDVAMLEISPISDARGSADYKRLLLGQLIKAHFITLFPRLEVDKILMLQ